MELIDNMLDGDVLSLARLISMVEREDPDITRIMKRIYPHLGKGFTIGITGPPGAGKSTMVDKLTAHIRKQGHTVGIVAADPSSPFTGGAVLGDRIRMQQHYLDEGVFIRSMATRGSLGGLPRTTGGVIKLLDAAGKDYILVETVGVGQNEIDIMESADTVVVMLVPEAGDTIQTMKAGLLEIADIMVVNKADRPGADNLVTELNTMLHMSANYKDVKWQIPVLTTQAANNIGISELFEQIEKHRLQLRNTGLLEKNRQEKRRREFVETVEDRVTRGLLQLIENDPKLSTYMGMVQSGEMDPYSAADEILRNGTLLASWSQSLAGKQKG